jgi:threonine dehydrogenase-like Zn-dependent dehydrogenase
MSGRHGVAVGCLWRHGRSAADDVAVRKQIQFRMGRAYVKPWIPDIMPFLTEDDPLGVDEFATHRLPLAEAPAAYGIFQRKADDAVKVMLKP